MLAAIVFASLAAQARADVWSLTTADFQISNVTLRSIDEHGLSVVSASTQQSQSVAIERFLELSRAAGVRPAAAPPIASSFILRLRNGDLLAGDPVKLDGDAIVWREQTLGNLSVPLAQAVGFARSAVDAAAAVGGADDSARLANGDAVHGVISEMTASTLSIQPAAGGDATAIPLASVRGVIFAAVSSANASPAATTPSLRIHLTDGSILSVAALRGDEWTMHLTLDPATFSGSPSSDVAATSITAIEQVNGPVIWLSQRKPDENIQTPYLDAEFPAKFDRTVLGGPIRAGDRVYAHGIGVHAYSRLSWTIEPGDDRFRTQYAVDDDAPLAAVGVRIKLDGQVVHAVDGLKAGTIAPVVEIELHGKHTLTLEVVDNDNAGVQARLNWIEPAFERAQTSTTQGK